MDRTNPMDKHMEVMINRYGMAAAPAAPQMFGNAGREHMEKYGTTYNRFLTRQDFPMVLKTRKQNLSTEVKFPRCCNIDFEERS